MAVSQHTHLGKAAPAHDTGCTALLHAGLECWQVALFQISTTKKISQSLSECEM